MLKAGSRLFNLKRRDAAPPPPPPPSVPQFTRREEIGPERKESKNSSSFNKNVVILVVVAAVLGTVVLFGTKRNSKKKKDGLESQEKFMIEEEARFQAEEKAYLSKKQELISEFERLTKERTTIMGQLKANFENAKRNQADFQTMFSEKKLEYGENDHENDSIDTAFMLKDDMEKKKLEMIDMGKRLGQENGKLMELMQQNKQAINEVSALYNSSYDGEKLPMA